MCQQESIVSKELDCFWVEKNGIYSSSTFIYYVDCFTRTLLQFIWPYMSFWITMHWQKTHRSSHDIMLPSDKVGGLMSSHRWIIITAQDDPSWNSPVKYCGAQSPGAVLLLPAALSLRKLGAVNCNNGLSSPLWFSWLLSFKNDHKLEIIGTNLLTTKHDINIILSNHIELPRSLALS